MPDMKVVATVDGWDSLSDRAKSFINFFMKDAVLQFHGVYNDGGALDHFSAHLQSKYRTMSPHTNDVLSSGENFEIFNHDDFVELVEIPYANESTSSVFPVELEGIKNIDIASTLTAKTSKLCLCKHSLKGYEGFEDYFAGDQPQVSVSYIISNNISLQPVDASTGESISQSYTPPITESNPDYEVSIVPSSGQTFDVTFDYKTTKMKLVVYNTGYEGATTTYDNVYYKIGFLPLSGTTEQACATWLSGSRLAIVAHWYYLFGIDSDYNELGEVEISTNYYEKDEWLFGQCCDNSLIASIKVPVRFIVPTYRTDVQWQEGEEEYHDYPPASGGVPRMMLFMQLFYDNNGVETPVSDYGNVKQIYVYNSEDNLVQITYQDPDTENYSDCYSAFLPITSINNS